MLLFELRAKNHFPANHAPHRDKGKEDVDTERAVHEYLVAQNRPYNHGDIFQNLHQKCDAQHMKTTTIHSLCHTGSARLLCKRP